MKKDDNTCRGLSVNDSVAHSETHWGSGLKTVAQSGGCLPGSLTPPPSAIRTELQETAGSWQQAPLMSEEHHTAEQRSARDSKQPPPLGLWRCQHETRISHTHQQPDRTMQATIGLRARQCAWVFLRHQQNLIIWFSGVLKRSCNQNNRIYLICPPVVRFLFRFPKL